MLFINQEKQKQKLINKINEYEKIGDYDNSLRISIKLEKYLSHNEKGELFFNIAEKIKKQSHRISKKFSTDLAIGYLIKALEYYPNDKPKIYNSIASCYLLAKNTKKASEYLKLSLLLDPMQLKLLEDLFQFGFSDFSFEDRRKFLEEMLHKYPQNAYLYYFRGKEFKENKIHDFKRAIELDPSVEYFYHDLILALESSGDFEEALKYLKLLKDKFSNSFLTFEKLGTFYKKRTSYQSLDDAKNYFLQAIQISPTNPDVHIKLGETYAECLEYDNAIKYLNIALDNLHNDHTRGEVFFSLAVLNNLVSNISAAIKCYQNAIKIDKKYLEEPYVIEVFDCEIIRLKNTLKQNNKNKSVLYLLASRFYDFSNYKEAANFYDRLFNLDPNYRDVQKKMEKSYQNYVDDLYKNLNIDGDYNTDYDDIFE